MFSEHPEKEIWEILLKFTYANNIERYLKENNFEVSEDLVQTIAGSFAQAYEYFLLSDKASLQVSPLLLYYGATNLLYGTSCLINGKLLKVKNHGIKLIEPINHGNITNLKFKFSDSNSGGMSVYFYSLSSSILNLTNTDEWSIKEVMGSIIETVEDFSNLYGVDQVYVVPLTKVLLEHEDFFLIKQNFFENDELLELINNIPDFASNYLEPQININQEMIIRRKVNGKFLHQISFTGQKFLSVGHNKNNINVILPYFLNFCVILFVFGSLCRYNPEIWNPFVQKDTTGEKNLIAKIIRISRRQLPNIVLNLIFGETHVFDNTIYDDINRKRYVNEEEVKELVEKLINEKRGN